MPFTVHPSRAKLHIPGPDLPFLTFFSCACAYVLDTRPHCAPVFPRPHRLLALPCSHCALAFAHSRALSRASPRAVSTNRRCAVRVFFIFFSTLITDQFPPVHILYTIAVLAGVLACLASSPCPCLPSLHPRPRPQRDLVLPRPHCALTLSCLHHRRARACVLPFQCRTCVLAVHAPAPLPCPCPPPEEGCGIMCIRPRQGSISVVQ